MDVFTVHSVEETLAKITHYFADNFKQPVESLELTDCIGRILARDCRADVSLPNFARATVDGFAVRAEDTLNCPVFLHIVGESRMGDDEVSPVESGTTVYVPTGGIIPPGADAMVKIEQVEDLANGYIAVNQGVQWGEGIMAIGEDVEAGTLILRKGETITPRIIGVLAALGIPSVEVFAKPRIALMATGDELTAPGNELLSGQVYEINSVMLSSLAEQLGAKVVACCVVRDEKNTIKELAEKLLDMADILVISGGSSKGKKDYTAEVIDDLGEPGVFINGVALKPGKPTIVGKVAKKALFGLPGHPVSAYVTFQFFVGHLLRLMLGTEERKIIIRAVLTEDVFPTDGREIIQMVAINKDKQVYQAHPLAGKSGAITLLMRAEGYLRVPRDTQCIPAGSLVDIVMFQQGQ